MTKRSFLKTLRSNSFKIDNPTPSAWGYFCMKKEATDFVASNFYYATFSRSSFDSYFSTRIACEITSALMLVFSGEM